MQNEWKIRDQTYFRVNLHHNKRTKYYMNTGPLQPKNYLSVHLEFQHLKLHVGRVFVSLDG